MDHIYVIYTVIVIIISYWKKTQGSAQQGCIFLIKNTIKTVTFGNIIQI